MLNDRSSILSLLETRRSAKPRELVGPGPTADELERILTIAARMPDHGKLTPWRFVTVGDDQRDALGAPAPRRRSPRTTRSDRRRNARRRTTSPIMPGSSSCSSRRRVEDHKIPVWEQQLSCGAAGMNLLLAAHALGYVAGWVTGWRAYSERVRAAFCGPGERIAGFIFIGHAGRELEDRPRPAARRRCRSAWQPPNALTLRLNFLRSAVL